MVDRCVQGLKVILPHILIVEGGPGHSPIKAAGPGIGRTLTAQASLGMVLASGDKGPLQWHLNSVLGGELQECLLQSPWASVQEWHLELLLDLLLGLDALRWPLLDEGPQFSPGNPKRLVYMAGSGPHHHKPVNVLVEAGQHSTPLAVSWKLRPSTHQQCPIINCPREAFEMAGVVHIQQGQGIRHALLLKPMPLLSASQCGEAQNFVGYNELLIHASLPVHLVKYIK